MNCFYLLEAGYQTTWQQMPPQNVSLINTTVWMSYMIESRMTYLLPNHNDHNVQYDIFTRICMMTYYVKLSEQRR